MIFHRTSAVRKSAWHKEAVARPLQHRTPPCARFGHAYVRLTETTWHCSVCKEVPVAA